MDAAVKLVAMVTLYGNFTTMGVVARCPEALSPDVVSHAALYVVEDGVEKPAHGLARVGATDHFAGSLFNLEPGAEYTVKVEFHDRAGNVLAEGTATGATRAEPAVPETEAALYVSPEGDDAAAGTLDEPLATIAAALEKASAGTTVFLREGTWYEGDIRARKGGSPGAPVILRAFEGEKPVLSGADPALIDAQWDENDGVYSAPFAGKTWNVVMRRKDSGEISRLYPLKTRQEILSGTSRCGDKDLTFEQLGFTGAYHCDGERIFVVVPEGGITDYEVYVSRFTDGIQLEGVSHYVFDGIEFRHYGRGDYGKAIGFVDSNENLVENCRFLYCNTGVWLKGASFNNTVQDSFFLDDLAHWHFSYTKTSAGWDYHRQIETGAVYTGGRYTGRGLVVRRNRIVDLFDGAHLGPWVEVNELTSETDFLNNTVINAADDFVETDGYSRNVRIVGNVMDRSLSGVSLAQALDGPTFIIRNVIANSGVCHATTDPYDYEYEGYPVKTNGGPRADVGSGPVFFYHNTSWTADPKSRAWLVKTARWRYFVFRNNIWCGKAMGIDVWHPPLSPVDWQYDCIYPEHGPFVKLAGKPFPALESAQTIMHTFDNCISVYPEFVNPVNGDFRLLSGSPCTDAGVPVPGINDDFAGAAPDIGAFEKE